MKPFYQGLPWLERGGKRVIFGVRDLVAAEPVGAAALMLWSGTIWHVVVLRAREAQRREIEQRRQSTRKRATTSSKRKGQPR